ncbi:MAG TPA: transglutaminase-like domain-containing protein [Syntrophales bacterium]|nr:transglutaminase-like domain-containing protein [Syntrophales bacterium]
MKVFWGLILVMPLLISSPVMAENFTVKGDMTSTVRYELQQQVTAGDGMKQMSLSFVVPQTFQSPTYVQEIKDFNLLLKPEPQEKKTSADARGNRIILATWTKVPPVVDVGLSCNVLNRTGLQTLETKAPFPLTKADPAILAYLKSTEQVQSGHPRIRELAAQLTSGVTTEFDAVQRVISWVVDHVHYTNPPAQYDALYSLESGKGNCQNFSHLSAALLRALDIPVRIINGVTLNQPFDVSWQKGVLTFKMGQGRHSWIEVWFPDQGWVPCDPQNTQLFVSNRFIRVEVGLDNNDTKNDGLLRWAQSREAKSKPKLQESIMADFNSDFVKIQGDREAYGPKNILLSPDVKAQFKQIAITPPAPPPVISEAQKAKLLYEVPFVFGNLVFPEDVDFAFPRTVKTTESGQFEMPRNFLVETAEYVTTNLTQYAQVVVLQKPLSLNKVGLALHNFGGDGWLWVDIFQDNEGKPGMPIATSELINFAELSLKPGYRWTDFEFRRENLTLMPGNYWIALGFSGNPIVNWFYTYGKPVGPAYGTRYKNIFKDDWSGALSFEFNYRLTGLTTK